MRFAILPSLISCLLFAAVGQAGMHSYRDEARSAADYLRKTSPPPKLLEEYGNILATFDTADELSLQNKTDKAEKLYQLVMLEFFILNDKLRPSGVLQSGKLAPALPSDHAGDIDRKNASTEATPTDVGAKNDPPQLEGPSLSVGAPKAPAQLTPVAQKDSSGNAATGKEDLTEDVEEEENPISSPLMVGEEFIYTVKKRDSLRSIGAKLGINWRNIARENDLDPKKPLKAGQELVVNTRRIIPKTLQEGILINIPDRTMYLFKGKKLKKTVPVALGMPTFQDYGDWRTPTGRFRIVSKTKNPTWHVPPSIQTEMKLNKKNVLTEVPPGDSNPLGKYAMMTSLSGILIHSTDHPESIYRFASHGCIRVDPTNMEKIFPEIPVHANGEIVYQPVKLAFSDDGRVFIEVHGDIYKRYKKLDEVAKVLIARNKAEQKVDWNKVRALLRRQSGIPEDVTLQAHEQRNQ